MATTQAADGTTIQYDDHGLDAASTSGPSIVLVHGITESSAAWAPVTELLARDHRVVTLDLRGHGASGTAERYDLEAMAGDVAAVVAELGLDRPHLVGHSLGGIVVSAAGAALPVSSVVNVDQSLQLASFKDQLMPFAEQLRDPAAFPLVIEGLFAMMAGEKISPDEMARINALRRPDQDVVLGVWDLILTMPVDEIAAIVDDTLAGYHGAGVSYLSLFGIDPGPDYSAWLQGHIAGAATDVWPDHGHYPHLVDPDRFVSLLHDFWS